MMETCKGLVDELNVVMQRDRYDHNQPTEFSSHTKSIHFYPSVVVFERGDWGKLQDFDIANGVIARNE